MNKTKQIKTLCIKIIEVEGENFDLINDREYKSLLGASLYISVKSKPDIAFSLLIRHPENVKIQLKPITKFILRILL